MKPPAGDLSVELVAECTNAPAGNVMATWPLVLGAMRTEGVASLLSQIGMAATIAVETGVTVHGRNRTFLPIEELASGAAYDTGRLAQRLGNTPEADGDGQRYKGRGLIQITGAANYKAVGLRLGINLITAPERACELPIAAEIAAAFWLDKGVYKACELGEWAKARKLVNGGLNGWGRFAILIARLLKRNGITHEA